MGKGQAHLELSLSIIDVASESFTSWKKTSRHILDPHKTPALSVSSSNSRWLPISRLSCRTDQVSTESSNRAMFVCLRKERAHPKVGRMGLEECSLKR